MCSAGVVDHLHRHYGGLGERKRGRSFGTVFSFLFSGVFGWSELPNFLENLTSNTFSLGSGYFLSFFVGHATGVFCDIPITPP